MTIKYVIAKLLKNKEKVLKIAREEIIHYRKGSIGLNNCGLSIIIKEVLKTMEKYLEAMEGKKKVVRIL